MLALAPSLAAAQLPSNAEVEANDTRSEASAHDPIGYDEGHRLYTGTIGTENDVDVYTVYAPPGSTQLNVSLTNTTPEPRADQLDATLTDSDGSQLATTYPSGAMTGETKDISYTVRGPGLYYVAVGVTSWGHNGSLHASYSFVTTSNRPLPRTDPICSSARSRAASARRKLTRAKAAYRHARTAGHKRALRRSKVRLRAAKFAVSRSCS